ncbi:GtrA family protein [Microvirga aerilata]|uniref:GtrA family protein n=1 Tax=Microvirga aerilata TaxID=670292 RepID=A0A936ZFW0_9HYPH|nr:GtrA family protein [Microvirga aerilata]MBL0405065.1 GtrA family protein [Microvirga aerilata]
MLAFLAVGAVSSIAYLAVMSAGRGWLGLSITISAFFAFCMGTAISYLGNTLFTFRSKVNGGTLARFLSVVVAGLVVNQAIAYGLNEVGVHYFFIALTVFVVVPVINFIGHSIFTYRGKRQ